MRSVRPATPLKLILLGTVMCMAVSHAADNASGLQGAGWRTNATAGERMLWLNLDQGVRVCVNAPMSASVTEKTLLIFYALPNGNTVEQTIGKHLKPGDDWHFNIQHIGAQTRFLRNRLAGEAVVVAYLENNLKSWPAWRRKFGDTSIPTLLETVKKIFPERQVEMVLSAHSGGGSFIFGYLNTLDAIPRDIVRIAFLDANYAYEAGRHQAKLASWLRNTGSPCLCVLAYNDAVALLDGKTFVSAQGGTWGKSHEMQSDLAKYFTFQCQTNAGCEHFQALNGRVQFFLKENPDKQVLHTLQVERNGFIHSLLVGTPAENVGYEYFGKPAYSQFIQDE